MGVFSKKNQNVFSPSVVSAPSVKPQDIPSTSRLGKSMLLKGELLAEEEVLIEGTLEGTIKSDGLVIVGKSGRVTAEIHAREVIIRGEVTGNVTGMEKVEIIPMGVLNGNIVSQRVVLAEGAIFKGNIDMSVKGGEKAAAPEKKSVGLAQKNQKTSTDK